jgi:hypothetical protein
MTPPTSGRIRFWLSLFAVLSVADLGLTWWLLRDGSGEVYEANPIAAQILESAGWLGLACFKGLVVGMVLGLLVFVARSRPRLAHAAVRLGCVLMILVVGYSGALVAGSPVIEPESRRHLREQQKRSVELDEQAARSQAFRHCLQRLAAKIARGERSLSDAVVELGQEPSTSDPDWLRLVHRLNPDLTLEQFLHKRLLTAVDEYQRFVAPTERIDVSTSPSI